MSGSYRPKFAQWVVGSFPDRTFDEDGKVEPVMVELKCERCGAETRAKCTSGAVNQKVQSFALSHIVHI